MAAAMLVGFVALYVGARLLVLGWQWALYPLALPAAATNLIAIALAALSAFLAWRLVLHWGPRNGPKLGA